MSGNNRRTKRPCVRFDSFVCPSPHCNYSADTKRKVSMHLSRSIVCRVSSQLETAVHDKDRDCIVDDTQSTFSFYDIVKNNDEEDIIDEISTQHLSSDESSKMNNTEKLYKNDSACYTLDQYFSTKLLDILNQVNAPHFIYKEIMEWAIEAKESNWDFQPKRITCSAQIEHL